jgi:hypothetical protein
MNDDENKTVVNGGYTIPEIDLDLDALSKMSVDTSYIINNTTANNIYSYNGINGAYGNVTIGNTSNNNYVWTTPNTSQIFTTVGSNGSSSSSGKLELEGENADVVINGKSLSKFMAKMEDRLAILMPDVEKLEKFAALKKAYDHYKLMEKLCHEEPINDDRP